MLDTEIVTHACFCDSTTFNVICQFDDYEISAYLLRMTCTECGAAHKAPTPLDKPTDDL